jgi:hypothetical protein
MYVPRQAIQTLEVVSLIGVSSRRRADAASRAKEQPELFTGETNSALDS